VILSDEDLIDLVARSQPEGVEMLYDRYGRLAYSLAHRVLGDAGAAEDVVQDAFLSVWRRASTYRADRGNVRAWICSIVHHRAIDRLRGRSGRVRQELPIEVAPARMHIPDTWEAVAAELERTEVARALDGLPAEQRQTIELAYFGGYSQTEISSLMKVPLGTVKGRTRLALRRLHSELESQSAGWSAS
jgi:RNA polymerase sigma-70 factor (ECF subfamily)